MVHLSPPFNPPVLKGLKVHPDNPFRFDFILDQGDNSVGLNGEATSQPAELMKAEAQRLIKYFLAAITVPEQDLWVNLSPYEKDRIVPDAFGKTEMGRDLLAQDYLLKQVTASLIYPEDEIGKKFWQRVYEEAAKKFGTTNIPVNTFNKVWIVPEKAVVYENVKVGTAYVVESKLKVMLEQDYLALEKNVVTLSEAKGPKVNNKPLDPSGLRPQDDVSALGSKIVRDIVIPELTKEINEGQNFAQLRQVYQSIILATWYKKKIKDSILAQAYANRNKVAGVSYDHSIILTPRPNSVILSPEGAKDPNVNNKPLDPSVASLPQDDDVNIIYNQYLAAFKKGVFNYIKEESVIARPEGPKQSVPRKYFSGGVTLMSAAMISFTSNEPDQPKEGALTRLLKVTVDLGRALLGYTDTGVEDSGNNPGPNQEDKKLLAKQMVDLIADALNGIDEDAADYFYKDQEALRRMFDSAVTKMRDYWDRERPGDRREFIDRRLVKALYEWLQHKDPYLGEYFYRKYHRPEHGWMASFNINDLQVWSDVLGYLSAAIVLDKKTGYGSVKDVPALAMPDGITDARLRNKLKSVFDRYAYRRPFELRLMDLVKGLQIKGATTKELEDEIERAAFIMKRVEEHFLTTYKILPVQGDFPVRGISFQGFATGKPDQPLSGDLNPVFQWGARLSQDPRGHLLYEGKAFATRRWGDVDSDWNELLMYQKAAEDGAIGGVEFELRGLINARLLKWINKIKEQLSPVPNININYVLTLPSGADFSILLHAARKGGLVARLKHRHSPERIYSLEDQRVIKGVLKSLSNDRLIDIIHGPGQGMLKEVVDAYLQEAFIKEGQETGEESTQRLEDIPDEDLGKKIPQLFDEFQAMLKNKENVGKRWIVDDPQLKEQIIQRTIENIRWIRQQTRIRRSQDHSKSSAERSTGGYLGPEDGYGMNLTTIFADAVEQVKNFLEMKMPPGYEGQFGKDLSLVNEELANQSRVTIKVKQKALSGNINEPLFLSESQLLKKQIDVLEENLKRAKAYLHTDQERERDFDGKFKPFIDDINQTIENLWSNVRSLSQNAEGKKSQGLLLLEIRKKLSNIEEFYKSFLGLSVYFKNAVQLEFQYPSVKFIYVVDDQGNIKFSPNIVKDHGPQKRISHAELNNGLKAFGAGELIFQRVDLNWRLVEINNGSGHYFPDAIATLNYVEWLIWSKYGLLKDRPGTSKHLHLVNRLLPVAGVDRNDTAFLTMRNMQQRRLSPTSPPPGSRNSDQAMINDGTPSIARSIEGHIEFDRLRGIRRQESNGTVTNEQMETFKKVFLEAAAYFPVVEIKRAVISSTEQDMLHIDGRGGVFYLSSKDWSSEDMLKFAIMRGLAVLQMDQDHQRYISDTKREDNLRFEERRLKEREARFSNLQRMYTPLSESKNEKELFLDSVRSVISLKGELGVDVRQILILLRWVHILKILAPDDQKLEDFLSVFPDQKLANFFRKTAPLPIDGRILEAASFIGLDYARLPWISDFGSFKLAQAIVPLDYDSYGAFFPKKEWPMAILAALHQQDFFDVDDNTGTLVTRYELVQYILREADKLSQDDANMLLRFSRSTDIIAQVKIVNNRMPDIMDLSGLYRFIDPKTVETLLQWYGTDYLDTILSKISDPTWSKILERMGPQIRNSLFLGGRDGIALLFSTIDDSQNIEVDEMFDFLDSVYGQDALIRAARRSPQRFIYFLSGIFSSYKGYRHPLMVATQIQEAVGKQRLREAFIRDPLLVHRQVGLFIHSDHDSGMENEIYDLDDLIEEAKKLKGELSERFSDNDIDKILDEDPFNILNLSIVFRHQFSLQDLHQLIDQYGKDSIMSAWKRSPKEFPLVLILLRDTDPDFVKRIGNKEYLNLTSAGVRQFVGLWGYPWLKETGKGRQLVNAIAEGFDVDWKVLHEEQHKDVKMLEDLNVFLKQHLPWISDELLRDLMLYDQPLLAELVESAFRMSIDISDEQWEDEGISRDYSKYSLLDEPHGYKDLEQIVDLFGIKGLREALRRNPQEVKKFFLTVRQLTRDQRTEFFSIWKVLQKGIGKAGMANLLKEGAGYLLNIGQHLSSLGGNREEPAIQVKKNIRALVQLGEEVWGKEELREHPLWLFEAFRGFEVPPEDRLMGKMFGQSRKFLTPRSLWSLLNNSSSDVYSQMPGLQLALKEGLRVSPKDIVRFINRNSLEGFTKLAKRFGSKNVEAICALDPQYLIIMRNVEERRLILYPYFKAFQWRVESFDERWASNIQALYSLGEILKGHTEKTGFITTALNNMRQLNSEAFKVLTSNAAMLSLVVEALMKEGQQITDEASMKKFIKERLLALVIERATASSNKGVWSVQDRVKEAQQIMELSYLGLLETSQALKPWLYLLDRTFLPIDQNGQETNLADVIDSDVKLAALIQRVLLSEDLNSEAFQNALGIAVQVPKLFRSIMAGVPAQRGLAIKEKAVFAISQRYFDALRYSLSDKWVLNYFMIHFANQLMIAMGGQEDLLAGVVPVSNLRFKGNMENFKKTVDVLSASSVRSHLNDMGILYDDHAFRSRNSELLAKALVFSLDNLNPLTEDFWNDKIKGFIAQNQEFQKYLEASVLDILRSDQRYKEEYQEALRLLVLNPSVGQKIIARILSSGLSPKETRLFRSDIVNALLFNQFNRLLVAEADLMLGQPSGQSLIPLASKLDGSFRKNPLTVEDLKDQLSVLVDGWDEETIRNSLDPFYFRIWGITLVPRLSILQNGYRGSRAFDDPQARYVTRAVTVALRYSWHGGEFAEGQGWRTLHQWNFSVLREQMKVLNIKNKRQTVVEFYLNKRPFGLNFILQDNEIRIVNRVGGAVVSKLAVPADGVIEKASLNLGTASPFVFQLGRQGDDIYLMRVDPNVALANHFVTPPGPKAYVRQVTTEGMSDLGVVRKLMRMQVQEQALKEEVLDNLERLNRATTDTEALWAIQGIRAALQDLDPGVSGASDGSHVPVGYTQEFFEHRYSKLKSIVDETLTMLTQRPSSVKLDLIRQAFNTCETIVWLKSEEEDVYGTFESYDRQLLLDKYHGAGDNRRMTIDRLVEVLRTAAYPSKIIRHLYEVGDLDFFLGEFTSLKGVQQGSFHQGTPADEHSLQVLEELDALIESGKYPITHPEFLRLMAVMHDTGKGVDDEDHSKRSAGFLKNLLKTIQMPDPMAERLVNIVELHRYLGQISASRTRRMANPQRTAELETPAFRASQEARVNQLAQNIKGGRSVAEALEDLEYLYFLTIADTSAIKFSDSLEFQMGEFNNDLNKINDLISAIMSDLNQDIPAIKSRKAGIKWLNNTIEPYRLLPMLLNSSSLDDEMRGLITSIQESYHVSSIVDLTEEQLNVLVITDQGKKLKRAILNTLYPLKTPKSQFSQRDTGTRYTTLFAKELLFIKEAVARAITDATGPASKGATSSAQRADAKEPDQAMNTTQQWLTLSVGVVILGFWTKSLLTKLLGSRIERRFGRIKSIYFDRLIQAAKVDQDLIKIDHTDKLFTIAAARVGLREVVLLDWLIDQYAAKKISDIEMAYIMSHEISHIIKKHMSDGLDVEIEASLGGVDILLKAGYSLEDIRDQVVPFIRRLVQIKEMARNDGALIYSEATYAQDQFYDRIADEIEKHLISYEQGEMLLNPVQTSKPKGQADRAMKANPSSNTGGIDFTDEKTPLSVILSGAKDLKVINKPLDPSGLEGPQDDGGIKFKIDPAMLKQLQDAPGFVPVIINIEPMTDLRLFLGIKEPTGQKPALNA